MTKNRTRRVAAAAWLAVATLAPQATPAQQAASAAAQRLPGNFGFIISRPRPGIAGAPVMDVVPGGVAAEIGIVAGDVIVAMNGEPVDGVPSWFQLSRRYREGDEVTFTIDRAGNRLQFTGRARAGENAVASRQTVDMLVAELATALEQRYVIAQVGARYAATLRRRLAQGAYYDLPDETAFGERVSADLKATFEDRHLNVVPSRNSLVTSSLSRSGRVPDPIERLERLTPGIAYMRFGRAPEEEAVQQQVVDWMKANADADVFIIDLRTARVGGRPALPRLILRYFFGEPTPVLWQDFRRSMYDQFVAAGDVVTWPEDVRIDGPDGFVRFAQFVTPVEGEMRLRRAKVYVLTSAVTGSAWELLAMSFLSTGRGIVIGETTAGRGNPSRWVPIGDSFRALIPHARLVDPRNGRGLEGSGVEPAVRLPAGDALREALVRSGVDRTRAEAMSAAMGIDPTDMEPNDRQVAPSRPAAR